MGKKVLLVYAGEKSKLPRFPLSVLALASYIRKKGYKPKIKDLRLEWNILKIDPEQYSCVCVSSMTGPDLISAIDVSKYFKAFDKNFPVIWGGHHASALPDQTLKEDYVDSVIIGEGEKALHQALQDIEKGELKEKYHADPIDMNKLDLPAYDLIDVKRYLDYNDEWSYETSRGCPHECRFCYVYYFHDRKWRHKDVDKVVSEIKEIRDKYNISKLKIIGDNFFVDKNFALEVCKKITPLNLKWSSTIRIDYICRYSHEDMQTIRDSGCWMLQMGAESGDQKSLDYIKKGITPEQSMEAVSKCVHYNIKPLLSLIIGMPGEKKDSVLKTLALYDQLDKLGGEINGVFVYGPYPGTPMYEDAVKMGYDAPEDLEGWANVHLRREKLPWHGAMGKELVTITQLSRFKFFMKHLSDFTKEGVKKKTGVPVPLIKLAVLPFRLSCYVRWKTRFFKTGFEWNIFFKILHKFTEVY